MRVFLLAMACLLLTPAATAHNTVETDDGAYFVTIGNLNEPTTTWMKTGLDLIIRVNDDGERGDEVAEVHQTMAATLIAPDGSERPGVLRTQHGAVGRYSFDEPYYLTQPGQYQLRMEGTIGDTAVSGTYNVSGPVDDYRDATFPDTATTPTELQASIDALEGRLVVLEEENAELKTRLAAVEAGHDENGMPGLGLVAVLGLIALGAFVVRRR